MKKERALEDMTHQDLIEALIFDENIQDNLYVSNDYAPDKHGNTLITIGFEETGSSRKKKTSAFILFTFSPKGRLVGMEVAVKKRGKAWEVAASEKLLDFATRFGTIALDPASQGKKRGN